MKDIHLSGGVSQLIQLICVVGVFLTPDDFAGHPLWYRWFRIAFMVAGVYNHRIAVTSTPLGSPQPKETVVEGVVVPPQPTDREVKVTEVRK